MNTDAFENFSTKYGLDSEIVASLCESFGTHVDLPKEKWFKYHPLVIENNDELVVVKDETIVYNVEQAPHVKRSMTIYYVDLNRHKSLRCLTCPTSTILAYNILMGAHNHKRCPRYVFSYESSLPLLILLRVALLTNVMFVNLQ